MDDLKYFLGHEVEFAGDSWYAPQRYLQSFNSVIRADHIDTTSSAGDWVGYVAIKNGDNIALVSFEQHNNWPGDGFTLQIDNAPFAFVSEFSDIDDAVAEYCERFYNY
jgi:hypothetical protein